MFLIRREQIERLCPPGLAHHDKIVEWQRAAGIELPAEADEGDAVYPNGWTAAHAAFIFAKSPRWLQLLEQDVRGDPPVLPVRRFAIDWQAVFIQTDDRGNQSLLSDDLRYYARTRGFHILRCTEERFGPDSRDLVSIIENDNVLTITYTRVLPDPRRKKK